MNTELFHFAARLRSLQTAKADNAALSRNPESEFNSLALNLFALQFKYNYAYQKICVARLRTPQTVEHWTQIPAVPTAAFKELELTSLAPDERTAVFHSSGTTEQKPSRHFHSAESLAVYEQSLWQWFRHHFDDANEIVFLTPNPKTASHSSLVHMFEIIRQKMTLPESALVGTIDAAGSWQVDFAAAIHQIKLSSNAGKPLTLLGTAFSFVHLLDYLSDNNLSVSLPKNSRVMETGGYKNRSRILTKVELHELITERLGVSRENIHCEYGMSELSSQAYAASSGVFQFPPWARAQIISPETGREVAEGETGLIRILDLANVFSVAAIQTEDLGIRRSDGFELVGRAQLAEPRGCSLMTA